MGGSSIDQRNVVVYSLKVSYDGTEHGILAQLRFSITIIDHPIDKKMIASKFAILVSLWSSRNQLKLENQSIFHILGCIKIYAHAEIKGGTKIKIFTKINGRFVGEWLDWLVLVSESKITLH